MSISISGSRSVVLAEELKLPPNPSWFGPGQFFHNPCSKKNCISASPVSMLSGLGLHGSFVQLLKASAVYVRPKFASCSLSVTSKRKRFPIHVLRCLSSSIVSECDLCHIKHTKNFLERLVWCELSAGFQLFTINSSHHGVAPELPD